MNTPATIPPTYASYGSDTTVSRALTLGEELTHKAGKSTVITEKLYLYPGPVAQYAANIAERSTWGTVTKISKWLGWQNQFSDIYVSNPPKGTKRMTWSNDWAELFVHALSAIHQADSRSRS